MGNVLWNLRIAYPNRPKRFGYRLRLYTLDLGVRLGLREGCNGRRGAWEHVAAELAWPHKRHAKVRGLSSYRTNLFKPKPVRGLRAKAR